MEGVEGEKPWVNRIQGHQSEIRSGITVGPAVEKGVEKVGSTQPITPRPLDLSCLTTFGEAPIHTNHAQWTCERRGYAGASTNTARPMMRPGTCGPQRQHRWRACTRGEGRAKTSQGAGPLASFGPINSFFFRLSPSLPALILLFLLPIPPQPPTVAIVPRLSLFLVPIFILIAFAHESSNSP